MRSPSPPSWRAWRRRALARISRTPMSLESSMKMGARASFSTARSTFGQRSALTRPLRSSSLDTLAWEADVAPRQLLELVDLLVEDGLDRLHLRRAAVVADPEQHALRPLDQLPRLATVGEHVVLELPRGAEHAAQQGVLLDDARV